MQPVYQHIKLEPSLMSVLVSTIKGKNLPGLTPAARDMVRKELDAMGDMPILDQLRLSIDEASRNTVMLGAMFNKTDHETFMPDLAPCTYHSDGELQSFIASIAIHGYGIFAVGWLRGDHEFSTGDTDEEFRELLELDIEKYPVMGYMGEAQCTIGDCREYLGSESVVYRDPVDAQVAFEAPTGILHYITAHNYLPPQEFIDAVMSRDIQYGDNFFGENLFAGVDS